MHGSKPTLNANVDTTVNIFSFNVMCSLLQTYHLCRHDPRSFAALSNLRAPPPLP